MTQWFVGKNNQQKGPFSEDQMKEFIAGGKVDSGTMVWHEGMAEWAQLDLTELASHVSAAPVAPAPTQPSYIPAPGAAPMGFNQQQMGQGQPNRAPMGYGQQPMGYGQQPMIEGNGAATASLVCSLIGVFLFGIILGSIGLIYGLKGLNQAKLIEDTAEAQGIRRVSAGRGKATAGVILGIFAILGHIAVLLWQFG